eukprot:gnl/Carplike_NY0171/747_a1033_1199.p1 GENE.gnl/Carplike_NY0171/747_a1033_1199~~gnl/Carplike_NY0171/747_a1033_1199.p1  ORF type:complete len:469 (+),score=129.12 gnl/Carplike_NY0171/747_a1033_1199:77-1483(+)
MPSQAFHFACQAKRRKSMRKLHIPRIHCHIQPKINFNIHLDKKFPLFHSSKKKIGMPVALKLFRSAVNDDLDYLHFGLHIFMARKVYRDLCRQEKVITSELPPILSTSSSTCSIDSEKKDFSSEPPSMGDSLSPSPSTFDSESDEASFSSMSPASSGFSTPLSIDGDYLSISTALPSLLPPRSPSHSFTVVLDMDHTLLHASKKYYPGFERVIKAIDKGRMRDFYVRSRPYAREMVQEIKRLGGEVVIYTAALQDYADQCLNVFDPSETLIDHRIYREGCVRITSEDLEAAVDREYDLRGYLKALKSRGSLHSSFPFSADLMASLSEIISTSKSTPSRLLPLSDLIFSNGYVKDLSRLGVSRPISSLFIVDDNPISYALQPMAAIPCREYRGEDKDEEMQLVYLALLQGLKDRGTCNVSGVNAAVESAEKMMGHFVKKPSKSRKSRSYRALSSFFCVKEEPMLLEGCM